MKKICVLGAGAWGSAIAHHLSTVEHKVTLWGRNQEQIQLLQKTYINHKYIKDYKLHHNLNFSSDLGLSLENVDLIVIVTPINSIRDIFNFLDQHQIYTPFIWASKGLENQSSLFIHEILEQNFSILCQNLNGQYGILSGPSFAKEVIQGLPTAIVASSKNSQFTDFIQTIFHSERFRVYTSDDLIGVELGGAIKNILAIATGLCDGMNFGLNARSALITRGLTEIMRLGQVLGAKNETLVGLSGLGDLILTCTGDLSRNRHVGKLLAEGLNLNQILEHLGHVAEGVLTTQAIINRSEVQNIDMPITKTIYEILYHNANPQQAVHMLLQRESKTEFNSI